MVLVPLYKGESWKTSILVLQERREEDFLLFETRVQVRCCLKRQRGRKGGGKEHTEEHTQEMLCEKTTERWQPWSLTRNQPERGLVSPELWENAACSPQPEKFRAAMNFCRSLFIQYKVYLFISSYFLITNVALLGWHYGGNRRFCG